jgi:hypothetical protein
MPTYPGYVGNPGGAFGLPDPTSAGTSVPASTATDGFFLPAGALRNVRNKLKSTNKVKFAVIGDSWSYGLWSSKPLIPGGTGVVDQFRTVMQNRYGNGGSGFRSVYDPFLSTVYAAYAGFQSQLASTTGTWNFFTGNGSNDGYGGLVLINYTTQTGSGGATTTGTVTWNNVIGSSIYVGCFGLNNVAYSVSVDGGAAVNLNTGATGTAIKQLVSSGLSPTTPHTVVLSITAGASVIFLNGIFGENPTGVQVDNYSIVGYTTFNSSGISSSTSPYPLFNGGPFNPADCIIFEMGGNDAGGNYAPYGNTTVASPAAPAQSVQVSYADDVTLFLDQALATTTPPDVCFFRPYYPGAGANGGVTAPASPYTAAKRPYQHYAGLVYGLANAYNAGVVDMGASARNSFPYWQSLGFPGYYPNTGQGPRTITGTVTNGSNVITTTQAAANDASQSITCTTPAVIPQLSIVKTVAAGTSLTLIAGQNAYQSGTFTFVLSDSVHMSDAGHADAGNRLAVPFLT